MCLDGTHPGWSLLPASGHPPAFFPVATFGAIFLAIFCHRERTPKFEFNSLSRIYPELPDCKRSLKMQNPRGGTHFQDMQKTSQN
ncbi:hypothetical protein VULLAG_LOCUS13306 [Vulpes lagopus]